MNNLNIEKMHYSGFKVRFAKLYNWIDSIDPEEDLEKFIKNKVCPYFDENLLNIKKDTGIDLQPNVKTSYVEGDYGPYVGFPIFTSSNGHNLKGKIRINTCVPNESADNETHYSKIWCIAENKEEISMNGKEISNALKYTREFSDRITKAIGKYYLDFVSNSPDIKEYWTSIESVAISPIDSEQNGLDSLFKVYDREKFLKIYNSSYAPKRSLADITEWLYNEEIKDPLKYIETTKDKDVEWRVITNDDADVFYAQQNTDGFFRLLGMGISKNQKGNVLDIDRAFKPQIASLISAL